MADLTQKQAFKIRQDRDYCICLPKDGLLYVEVPDFYHLMGLLLTQRWNGEAHLRTLQGKVPYFGGGIAFDFWSLFMHGVRPVWYTKQNGDYNKAIEQLIEDGIFNNQLDASHWAQATSYGGECEWLGQSKMRFDPKWIKYIWAGPRATLAQLTQLKDLFPKLDIHEEAPERSSGSPCRTGSGKQAGLLEVPPNLYDSMLKWMQGIYAGQILANVEKALDRSVRSQRVFTEKQEQLKKILADFPRILQSLKRDQAWSIDWKEYGGVDRFGVKRGLDYYWVGTGKNKVDYTSYGTLDLNETLNVFTKMVDRRLLNLEQLKHSGDKGISDVRLVELQALRKECLQYTDKPNSYATKAEAQFPVDLSGWSYLSAWTGAKANALKKVMDDNERQIEALLSAASKLNPEEETAHFKIVAPRDGWTAAQEPPKIPKTDIWIHKVGGANPWVINQQTGGTGFINSRYLKNLEQVNPAKALGGIFGDFGGFDYLGNQYDRLANPLKHMAKEKITAILWFKPHTINKGQWSLYSRQLEVDLEYTDATNLEYFHKGLSSIDETLIHELRHVAQDYLNSLLSLPADSVGMPSKGISTSVRDLPRDPREKTRPDHALRDEEFYPRLGDEIKRLKIRLREFPKPEWRMEIADVIGQTGTPESEFFRKLKKFQPDKWKKAVTELFKGLGLEVPAMTQKQAGILEPPPAMVKDIGEWVQAQVAANQMAGIEQSLESEKQRPAKLTIQYKPLIDSIAVLRKELPAGAPKILFNAAKQFAEEVLGQWGYGWAKEPKVQDYQKLDPAKRQQLVEYLTRSIEKVENRIDEDLHGTVQTQRLEKDAARLHPFIRSGISPMTGDSITKKFEVDLEGWKYGAEAIREALRKSKSEQVQEMLEYADFDRLPALKKKFDDLLVEAQTTGGWGHITVTLTLKPDIKAGGWWQSMAKTLSIAIDDHLYPWDIEGKLMNTLYHELQHMSQDVLRDALAKGADWFDFSNRNRKPVPGMPSRHIMTPTFHQEDKPDPRNLQRYRRVEDMPPSAQDIHALDDIEFHTELRGAVQDLKAMLKNLDLHKQQYDKRPATDAERKQLFKWAVGAGGSIDGLGYHQPIKAMMTWKRLAPGKWRFAVKELTKEFQKMPVGKAANQSAAIERVASMWLSQSAVELPKA